MPIDLNQDSSDMNRREMRQAKVRTPMPVPVRGCCCENIYGLEILTEYTGRSSHEGSYDSYVPAYWQFSMPELQDDPFYLWFRRDTSIGSGIPETVRYISDQFTLTYQGGEELLAHWEFRQPVSSLSEHCSMFLYTDAGVNHTIGNAGLFRARATYGLPPRIPIVHNETFFDYLSQIKLPLTQRIQLLSRTTFDEDMLLPIAKVPSYVCLTPHKYPASIEDETPLTQLWEGTPPTTIHVSLNGGAAVTLNYLLSGKLDCYGDATAPISRYALRAVMDGTDVDTSKVMLTNVGPSPTLATGSWQMIEDFTAPLDITVTDGGSRTLRFYE